MNVQLTEQQTKAIDLITQQFADAITSVITATEIPAANDKGLSAVIVKHSVRKQRHDEAYQRNKQTLEDIKCFLCVGDADSVSYALEAFHELSEEDQQALWLSPSKGGWLSNDERKLMISGGEE